jgi:hypothetical protein
MAKKSDSDLNAENLKQALWETLQGVRVGSVDTNKSNAIARQAREVVRVHMAQLATLKQPAIASEEMLRFVDPERLTQRGTE